MTVQWFRFFSAVVNDAKVQRLPGDLFKSWVNVLCLANEATPRGHINPDDLAFGLRCTDAEAEALVARLMERELLEQADDGSLVPHNWHKRQPSSDDSGDRVRAKRERDRQGVAAGRNGSVTAAVTAAVTDTSGDEKRLSNALEQSRADTEQSRGEQTQTPRSPAREDGPSADASGTGYPPDFETMWSVYPVKLDKGAAHKAWKARRKEGHTADAITAAVEHYANYARASPLNPKHCSTFLGSTRPFLEWVDDIPEAAKREMGATRHGQARRTGAFGASATAAGERRYDHLAVSGDDEDVPDPWRDPARAAT